MVYRGNTPKPADERTHRRGQRWDTIPIEWDGVVRLPDLPDTIDWCASTLRWWKVWQESPQSMIMIETDYQVMLEAAYIHHRALSAPADIHPTYLTNLFAELRRRVSAYGATWEDRMKLRMSLDTPQSLQSEKTEMRRAAQAMVDYVAIVAEGGEDGTGVS